MKNWLTLTFVLLGFVTMNSQVTLNLQRKGVCENTITSLFGGSPSGGFYSGPGVFSGRFNASSAGVGSHTITYTYTHDDGTTESATDIMEVYSHPEVSLDLTSYTVADTLEELILNEGLPTGGTYSGRHVSGNKFSPTLAGLGLHWIRYTYEDENGCKNSVGAQLEVVYTGQLNIVSSVSDVDCSENETILGTIDLKVSGGMPPYSYTWSSIGGNGLSDTGPIQEGLTTGIYYVTISDSTGDTYYTDFRVKQFSSSMEIEGAVKHLSCNAWNGPADGNIFVTVAEGIAPYTYEWTTVDGSGVVQGVSNQTSLSAGTYDVIVTDMNGCTGRESWTITEPPRLESCNFSKLADGGTLVKCEDQPAVIEVIVNNPSTDYTYSLEYNENMQDDNRFLLDAGRYTFYAYEKDGCIRTCKLSIVNKDENLPAGAEVTYDDCSKLAHLNVSFFYDENQNGIKDNSERNLSTGAVSIDQDIIRTNFREEGFIAPLEVGRYVTVSYDEDMNLDWYTTGEETYEFFADSEEFSQDLEIGLYPHELENETNSYLESGRFRCGELVDFWINVVNQGTVVQPSVVYIQLDPRIEEYEFIVPPHYNEGNGIVGWNIPELYPEENYKIPFSVRAPLIDNADQVGEKYIFKHGTSQDLEANGTYTEIGLRCSYDPNDKQVSPNREDNLALIAEPLFYKIRFQNTGNDYARNVLVVDTLDENLDLSTFKLISTSHPEELNVIFDDGQTVTFDFENIFLPDSTTNEVASNGFISYTIEVKENVTPESSIDNTAYIYFDFNPAIITNTTESIMVDAYPEIIYSKT